MFTERRYSKGVRPLRLLDSEIDVTQQDKYTEVIQEEGMAFGQCTRTFGRIWGLKPKYLYQLNLNNFCLTNFLIMDVLCDDKKDEVRTIQTKFGHPQRRCVMAISGEFCLTMAHHTFILNKKH